MIYTWVASSLGLLVLLSTTFSVSSTDSSNHADIQIQWIRENGGFFSPKVAFQLLDPNDRDSPFGVFALDDIAKGETIIVIPKKCLVTCGTGSEKTCDTARNLVKQRMLGDDSFYSPYVDYVFDPKHRNQLPSSWSEKGQKLIKSIIGKELPPYGLTTVSFAKDCGDEIHGDDPELQQEAHLIVLRRSWDDIMVPVFDMINHRNGKWYNVDSNSAHEGKDITVFASRAIKKGEQLYLSYNECADCHGYEWTYVLPEVFRDYGFVEQYPRRWNVEDLPFEIDQDDETEQLFVRFLDGKPDQFQKKFMRAQLKRLKGLKDYVSTEVQELDSPHERFMSVEYYEALMTAFELVLEASEPGHEQVCSVSDDKETCAAAREYDTLDSLPTEMKFNYDICDFGRIQRGNLYEEIYYTSSHYQDMQFKYSSRLDDTCLYMNNHLHACASFRPHYHEVFVHYPAMFVDEVKRVAFIGGGDNMIVHEILKYPSLELAVGLELDQGVVRSSFLNFGTQPHFDDPRLQWWFGDGSKSILMLPEEYYGSFDVVYVDLQNDVVDILQVANELDITSAAMLLMKPDGVIARNEDWEFGTVDPFTDYTADILYVDIPVIGYQGMTLGSNTVDFLTATPKDHGVETIYMKTGEENEDPFGIWYNYRKSVNRTSAICKEAGAPDRNLLTDELRSGLGVLLIVDAEEVAAPLKESLPIENSIRDALKNAELTEIASEVILDDDQDEDGYEIVYILKEGYAVVRVWPQLKYCALDLLLWSSTNKMEATKSQFIAAVDSKSVSSYRIMTSGMYGVVDDEDKEHVGPRITEPCKIHEADDTDASQVSQVEQSVVDSVVMESLSLLNNVNSLVVVLCGEQSSECSSLNVLKKHDSVAKATPIWACPSLKDDSSSQDMIACEMETLRTLQELDAKIDGIVIDSSAPRAVGQILLKIMSVTKDRNALLAENHVVSTTSSKGSPESTWRRSLVDRFRTQVVKYDPAYRAEVAVGDLNLDLFCPGDEHFFDHLVSLLALLESKTGKKPIVTNVKNGINNYVADFEPSVSFTHSDYNETLPLQQYRSQNPIETQTIYQFSSNEALDMDSIVEVFQNALSKLTDDEISLEVYDNVGDGRVLTYFWSMGSIVAVWDGRRTISVNLMSDEALAKMETIMMKDWEMLAREEMPRGTGKVVNFRPDVKPKKLPHWAVAAEKNKSKKKFYYV